LKQKHARASRWPLKGHRTVKQFTTLQTRTGE